MRMQGEDILKREPSLSARIASMAEYSLAFIAGCASLFCAFLFLKSFSDVRRDGGFGLIAGSSLCLWFGAVAWRSAKSGKAIADGAARPASLFSLHIFSGFTMLIVCGICVFGSMFVEPYAMAVVHGRGEAAEGLGFLDYLQAAQERYRAVHGVYSDSIGKLNSPLVRSLPHFFTCGPIQVAAAFVPSWKISLHREPGKGRHESLARYGTYTLIFDSAQTPPIDCVGGINPDYCRKDLLPRGDDRR